MLKLEFGLHRIPESTVTHGRVLDIGCGTGIWARDVAHAYPHAHVLGIDIAPPPLTTLGPGNCTFRPFNVAHSWTFPEAAQPFDFIHSRLLVYGIQDWPTLFGQVLRNLKPGGYFQIIDVVSSMLPAGEADPSSPCKRWTDYAHAALARQGINYNEPYKHAERVADAGFEIVEARRWPLYVDPAKWRGDHSERAREAGKLRLETSMQLMGIMAERIFEGINLSLEEGRALTREAQAEMRKDAAEKGHHGR